MHIKQIIIQGFKSYKEQTVIEPFSSHHNVIVGRNGSGKSNFFAAVRFVLSDSYTQLSREERQALLHEGAGSAAMSAYVELIFDNQDGRFPTETDEVILRRTIGQKKDEYSLNRKNTTKGEVMNMLETAGFSKDNPYYIVPQGRVTTITNMKDAERLQILKKVAGTDVYDNRRSESQKIMDDTEHKRGKIDELLKHIRGRLAELEEEKDELRAFQDRDRERRCLEYTIHQKDKEALQEALDKLKEDREAGVDQTDENRDALSNAEEQSEAVERQINELQQRLNLLATDKAQLEDERRDTAKEKAKAELDVQAMSDNQAAAQQTKEQTTRSIRDITAQIQQCEQQLAQLMPDYNAKRDQEKTLKQQLHDAESNRQRLLGKQGRQAQFKSKKERDQWLRSEIEAENMALATRKAVAMGAKEQIRNLETEITQAESDIAELRDRIDNRGDEQQNLAAEVQKAQEAKEKLMDQRKELWREEVKVGTILENAQREQESAERTLSTMMDQNTSRGLASVRRIVQEHQIEGAYGMLGELFEFPERYKTAVEVTAGASLFHYLVDTDETATQIVEVLKKTQGGRVTFVPLNRIKPRQVNIPKAPDAVHLVSKLRFQAEFEPAFQQVFGSTVVCPNLDVASQYARTHGINAITPQGDVSDRKGALTGGYVDAKNSRLDGIDRFRAAREELEKTVTRQREIQQQVQSLTQQITKANDKLQRLNQQRKQADGGYGPMREELRRLEYGLNLKRDELGRRQDAQENTDRLVREANNTIANHQAEVAGDFKKALSNAEEDQLEQLDEQLPDLRRQYRHASNELSAVETTKSGLDLMLRENLRPQLDQLQSFENDADVSSFGSGSDSNLKERQRDLKRIAKSLAAITTKLEENEQEIEEAQLQLSNTQVEQAAKQKQIEELNRALKNHQKAIEKGAQKQAALNARLTEVSTHIRNLGVLPDAAFTPAFQRLSSTSATSRLHKVQTELKKYGHVNKKAFEQFAQFERQREVLETRRKELKSSDESIRELIDVLDQRKDEAIQRTFKQVSKAFEEIFEKLVPAGKGKLIIQRRSDQQARGAAGDDDSDDEQAPQRTGVESYTGVGISVSFNSKHDEQQRIQQLSGGQKSLCALALVFAIQASDPAPFYLFDEIDANLDAQYRTAVAELLKESSQTGQFICTTFRPEMLLVANKCYGVSYLNKASSIDVVSREQALDFVEGQISGGK